MSPVSSSSTQCCAFAFHCFVNPILILFGLLMNLSTVFGLRRLPEKDNVTIWLLKTLALLDSIYLSLIFMLSLAFTITRYTYWTSGMLSMYKYSRLILQYPILIAHNLIIWIVVLVTVGRYLAVCKPMDIKWRDLRRMKAVVKWLVVLAVILNAP